MEEQRDPPSKAEVTQWLTEHGDILYRYALKRICDPELAEDLVQDTFVAALRSSSSFAGRSKVQTWLVGILRHKIADYLRKLTRQRERESETREQQSTFQNGEWRVGVQSWPDQPWQSLENQEFWQVLERCRNKLPATLADAFRMRDLEDLPMNDICELLGITATNLSVRLHRARILMRECLDQNWFAIGRQS